MNAYKVIHDLKSIKLPGDVRERVLFLIDKLKSSGDISIGEKKEIISIAKRYDRSLKNLYNAREKGRKTLALKKLGITRSKADELVMKREDEKKERREDLGF